MTDEFDGPYWERHWNDVGRAGARGADFGPDANPHVIRATEGLRPGTALDAGCGAGAEAIWLAAHGWSVTGVDISSTALAEAVSRETAASLDSPISWIEADLTTWEPASPFDLVTTHYAHPATSQLDFYELISHWVAPGGRLLIVGHRNGPKGTSVSHRHPESSLVTVADIVDRFRGDEWHIVAAEERERDVPTHDEGTLVLHDAVVLLQRAL